MTSDYDAPEPEMQEETQPESDAPDEGHGTPQLINSEVCPDAEPGQIIKLRVLKKHEQELEVQYVGMDEGEEKEPEGGEPEPEMAESGGGMMD